MSKNLPNIQKTRRKTERKQSAHARSGSIYDKIIKENFDISLKTLIQDIDGLQIVKSVPLQTKMQHTKERDPDNVSLIWLPNGKQKILHIEVQLKDEYEINARLCEYYLMLNRKKRTPKVVQYLIYIGSEDPKHMTGLWETEVLSFRYRLIVLKKIPYQLFLEANNPESVVLSILANLQDEEPEVIGKKIMDRITALSKTQLDKERYFTQLRVLANARKLQPKIDSIMASISKLIDISNDPLYMQGIREGEEKGIEKGRIDGIKAFIINTDYDDEAIANFMSISREFVRKIREEIHKDGK